MMLGMALSAYRDIVGEGVVYGLLSFPFAYILFTGSYGFRVWLPSLNPPRSFSTSNDSPRSDPGAVLGSCCLHK